MYEVLLEKALQKVIHDLEQLERRLCVLHCAGRQQSSEALDLLGLISKRRGMALRIQEEISSPPPNHPLILQGPVCAVTGEPMSGFNGPAFG